MASQIIKWFINTVALLFVLWVMPGISVDHWQTAVVAALVLGLLNSFLRPVIIYLTLPLQIFSLGLATLFLNGLLFLAAGKIVEGFRVDGFASAFFGAILFSVVSFLLNIFVSPPGNVRMHYRSFHVRRMDDRDVIDVEGKPADDEG